MVRRLLSMTAALYLLGNSRCESFQKLSDAASLVLLRVDDFKMPNAALAEVVSCLLIREAISQMKWSKRRV